MPRISLKSTGSIPNHKLLKNLQLQSHYISNDGGDEGISIQDDGDVIINGDTKLYLNDAGGEYLNSDGDNLIVAAGADLVLDGGSFIKLKDDGTYYGTFSKSAGNSLAIASVGDLILNSASATDHIKLGSGTGFNQVTASFDAADTNIDFRDGNKQILTLTADITNVHFQFPAVSGNFLCIFLQDGTGGWDVSAWKTKDVGGDAGAGNSGRVKWAGGTATTLTETADKADIVSIYWDATNEMAYAVASENF